MSKPTKDDKVALEKCHEYAVQVAGTVRMKDLAKAISSALGINRPDPRHVKLLEPVRRIKVSETREVTVVEQLAEALANERINRHDIMVYVLSGQLPSQSSQAA
jgi:hypothetical protein